jgi:hypothetical protein
VRTRNRRRRLDLAGLPRRCPDGCPCPCHYRQGGPIHPGAPCPGKLQETATAAYLKACGPYFDAAAVLADLDAWLGVTPS